MPNLPTNVPKNAIVLPSNVRAEFVGGNLILQNIKRRVKKFKMTLKQRNRISAASRKFKWPIMTTFSVGPAVILSAQAAMRRTTILERLQQFLLTMISYYTGAVFSFDGTFNRWELQRLAVGWGPIIAVGGVKLIAKGRIMAINRALSRAQIPANLS